MAAPRAENRVLGMGDLERVLTAALQDYERQVAEWADRNFRAGYTFDIPAEPEWVQEARRLLNLPKLEP